MLLEESCPLGLLCGWASLGFGGFLVSAGTTSFLKYKISARKHRFRILSEITRTSFRLSSLSDIFGLAYLVGQTKRFSSR